jgi:hypothetical protein
MTLLGGPDLISLLQCNSKVCTLPGLSPVNPVPRFERTVIPVLHNKYQQPRRYDLPSRTPLQVTAANAEVFPGQSRPQWPNQGLEYRENLDQPSDEMWNQSSTAAYQSNATERYQPTQLIKDLSIPNEAVEDVPGEPAHSRYEDYGVPDQNRRFQPSDPAEDPTAFHFNPTDFSCNRCLESFPSNTKLHKHIKLRNCRPSNKSPSQMVPLTTTTNHADNLRKLPLLESSAERKAPPGFSFRTWKYATVAVALSPEGSSEQVCVDSGCTMSLIDRDFLHQKLPNARVQHTKSPILVRGIGSTKHSTSEYVDLDLFFSGSASGKPAVGRIRREVHVVEGLRAGMLMGVDILGPERMVIDFAANKLIVGSCQGLSVDIAVKSRENAPRIDRRVKVEKNTTIAPRTIQAVPVYFAGTLPPDLDYEFVPKRPNVYSHITDANLSFVQVKNPTDKPLSLPHNALLGQLTNWIENDCYAIGADSHDLSAAADESQSKTEGYSPPRTSIDLELKTKLGLVVYGEPAAQQQLEQLASEYPLLWQDHGYPVDIPMEDWLRVPLIDGYDATKLASRVYPLSQKDKDVVDSEFNKMQAQGRMEWTRKPTPFGFPVFVVWKTVIKQGVPVRKSRVVVDIRGLNKITLPDAYPLPLQADITAAIQGCQFISTMDCSSFFHQWRVHPEDRSKLTVVSHRGQEQYNVATMGFRNSPPYVQRQMDRLLWEHRGFARGFIDDIVIFSKTLSEHLVHLRRIFTLFSKLRISLSPLKSYLGFPSIKLLGQRVDGLGLTTADEKLEALTKITFPFTLKELETYLGLSGWLRSYVPFYAQISKPLQDRKTALLKSAPQSGQARKNYSSKTTLNAITETEERSFMLLRNYFARPTFLAHHDPTRQLYIDIDASKAHGFGVMMYHVHGNPDLVKDINRQDIQPILFLSKLLNDAERNYWPTELEVAALVWALRKLRHFVEASTKPPIVFTDHSAATSIVRQTSLSSSNTDKLNLRLVRASQYLSQYQLDVRHKPGKQNLVPDALSRLRHDLQSIQSSHKMENEEGTLDALYVYHTTMVELGLDLKEKFAAAYRKDKTWNRIISELSRSKSTEDLDTFVLEDRLLYFVDPVDKRRRLVIPRDLEAMLYRLSHDEKAHQGFNRAYVDLRASFFIRNLSRRLRLYLEHCPHCQLNQTKRHPPYGSLRPIQSPPIPFHTIAIDFVLGLPSDNKDEYDTLLTITDKFSKRVTMAPGKETYTSSDWADKLLVALADWGIPRRIISDRDPKFLSALWKHLFRNLDTALLLSTAYHPQTDGQSERTNQTIEIALRFYLLNDTTDSPQDWVSFLPTLRSALNNAPNAATGRSPNEIVYGFRTNDRASLLRVDDADYNMALDRNVHQREAADAIAFAQLDAKVRYDHRHQPLRFESGQRAFLRLNHGYKLPGRPSRKLGPQRAGPFTITRPVGNLAYELQLPTHWRIHPVVSVAQLEPAPNERDPYDRPRPISPVGINEEGDTRDWGSFEIEALVDRRERRYGRSKPVKEYLVRWKDLGPEYDQWYGMDLLAQRAMELVEEYDHRELTKKRPVGRPKKKKVA